MKDQEQKHVNTVQDAVEGVIEFERVMPDERPAGI